MAGRNNSFETSWADQWDYSDPITQPEAKKTSNGGTAKYKKKVEEGFDKTKSAASTSFKKVKEGTSVGFQWIKNKCSKTGQKS